MRYNPLNYKSIKLCAFLKKLWVFVFFTGLLLSKSSKAQSGLEYDEVSIYLSVQRIGGTEIPALIHEQTAYLPVSDIFDFLRIKNNISVRMDSISGTFINPQSKFIIDKPNSRIIYNDKIYRVKPGDLISTSTNLYLRSDYFGEIFGLNCTFNFRNLSVILSTELELPVIREMRLEQMRTNVNKLKGVVKADTIIGRDYPLIYFGMADYTVFNSTENHGGPQDTRASLALGGVIAGGETNVVLNYHNNEPFNERQQYYMWRLANNEHRFAKQVLAGKIYSSSIATIFAPIVGIQLTNTPTTYRRSFGTYTLSNYTEPNWIVELYVNNVLISYVKADASGFYSFNVPLVYGNSIVKLRLYGPYGEERSSEQNISIPFNFLPINEFEYTATTGIVEDGYQSRFSRFSGNYGLTGNITIGGGTEYLSSITSGTAIPFVNTSMRLLSNLLLSGEYDYGVRSKAILSYNLPSGLQFELNDAWYKKGQTAINSTFLEDRRVSISIPVRGRIFSAYSRITLEQFILPATKYTTAEWMLSGALGKINGSINTFALFTNNDNPYLYSSFSVATRVLKNAILTQQLQYEYVDKKVIGVKTEFEKRLFGNGFLNVSYERNFSSNLSNIEVGLRYDFSFAQTGASVRKSNNVTRYLQSINGSLIHDSKTKYTSFNNHTSVGKGAVIIIPYLDLNGNGKRDANEPRAPGLKVQISGGRVEQSIKDTTIRITDLEAYTNYNIELDATGFDKVAWQLRKKIYSVAIDPNFVKKIEVPIAVSGEVSGRVIIKNNTEDKGLGRMLIGFYNDKSVMIARTVTEVDGYYTYLGLLPGTYSAQIDTSQLNKLHLISVPGKIFFTILRNNEGSVVEGIEFEVKSSEGYTNNKTDTTVHAGKLHATINNTINVVSDGADYQGKSEKNAKDSIGSKSELNGQLPIINGIVIQAAHFRYNKALIAQEILKRYHYNVIMVKAKKGYFNIRIIGLEGIMQAKIIIKKMRHIGFPLAYILKDNKH